MHAELVGCCGCLYREMLTQSEEKKASKWLLSIAIHVFHSLEQTFLHCTCTTFREMKANKTLRSNKCVFSLVSAKMILRGYSLFIWSMHAWQLVKTCEIIKSRATWTCDSWILFSFYWISYLIHCGLSDLMRFVHHSSGFCCWC